MTFTNRYLTETVTGNPEFGIKAGQFSNGRRLKNTDREEVTERKKIKKCKNYTKKVKNLLC